MKLLHLLLVSIFITCFHISIFAIKAYPFPVTITQPDGTELTIRIHGDEYKKYRTTEDGFLIKENAKGYLTYATLEADGTIKQSDLIARNMNKRTVGELNFLKTVSKPDQIVSNIRSTVQSRMKSPSTLPVQRAYPTTGSPKSLVILVKFSDNDFYSSPTPQTAFTNLLNQSGYSDNSGTGSARDYFMSASYGKFAPEFVVFGPVTLPNNIAYYGTNDTNGNDVKPEYMIIDACKAADDAGLDFSPFDTDNNGVIDNVFVYYAGYNEAEGGATSTIWPHRWDIASSGYSENKVFDGKTINDYACSSELRGKTNSNMCGIGTFCHEFGHVIGLPDYYHTSSSSKNTLNYWSIMDLGAYLNSGRTPPTYSVYDRFFLGWLTPQEIKTPSTLMLNPIYQGKTQPETTNEQAYLLSASPHNLNGASPSPTEFFMLEYRKKIGWDTYLPKEGMLIWHIDYNSTLWNNNTPNNYTETTQTTASHMRVYLQPLSGSTTTPGDAFTSGSFTPTTWSGVDINRAVTNIQKNENSVWFNFMDPIINTIGNLSNFTANILTNSAEQSIVVNASNLTQNLVIGFLDAENFEIKLSTQSNWSKSLTITPTNGNISVTIHIRFNSATAGIKTTQLEISTNNKSYKYYLNIMGEAIDPTAPVLKIGKVESVLQFAATKVNGTKTKTLNIKTTDLIGNLSLTLTGENAQLFTISATSITKEAANANAGTNITIQYKPVTTGIHTATLTVSGGGLNPEKIITLSGEGM